MTDFSKIYHIVSQIPKGKVLTYKNIAEQLSIQNPRFVGFALHRNRGPKKVPCHRVVRSDGTIASGFAFGGKERQKQLLKLEGVPFLNKETIDLKRALYHG